jgi:VWFA-related protein
MPSGPTKLLLALLLATSASAAAQGPPLALSAEVSSLGRGAGGTVVAIVIRVAPEDRERAGERLRVVTTLRVGENVVDRQGAVVTVEPDGSTMVFREWAPAVYELQVTVASVDGPAAGVWFGEIEVLAASEPYQAPDGAPVDAIALALSPPRDDAVSFRPPPNLGGLGAVQLEVDAPAGTAAVEFFRDGQSLGRRNRAPWTVSIPLGSILARTEVRAAAFGSDGAYLGEDAIVLNNPSGQIGVAVLLAPEASIVEGRRTVTVAVNGGSTLSQVTLSLDDRLIARWASCPCVVEVPVAELAAATIVSAEAVDTAGTRGDAILTLGGGGGFVGSVRVELVELPVVVLDDGGVPVVGLEQASFTVLEDGAEVPLEGFGTTRDLPLSLAIAVDTSGSMIEDFPQVKAAVRGFATELLRPGDQATLIRFSWDAKVEIPWTDVTGPITGNLEGIVPEGGTSLHDAVVRSLEQFRGRRGRQAVVLLTDGEDTTSRTGWSIAERFAQTMRVPIFTIGLGVGKLDFSGRGVLKDLAATTGGEAFFPRDVSELPAVYERIAELLRSQYLLWYSSPSEKPSEAFRTIEVRVGTPGATVKTITGYYPGR